MHRLLTVSALLAFSLPLAARHISKPPVLPAPKPQALQVSLSSSAYVPPEIEIDPKVQRKLALVNAIISGNISAVKEHIEHINTGSEPVQEWRSTFWVREGERTFEWVGFLELAVLSGHEAVLKMFIDQASADTPASRGLFAFEKRNEAATFVRAVERAASRNQPKLLKMLLDVVPQPHKLDLRNAFDRAIMAGSSDCVGILASVGYSGEALVKAIELGQAEIVRTLLRSQHADAMIRALPPPELITLPKDLRLHDVVWAALTDEAQRWLDSAVRKKFPPTPPRRAKVREGALVSDASQLLLNNEVESWKKFRAESPSDKSDLLRFAYEFNIQNVWEQETWIGSLIHLAALYGRDGHIRELARELGPSVDPVLDCVEYNGAPTQGTVGPSSFAIPTSRTVKNRAWTPLRVAVHAGQLKAAAVLIELEGENESWRSSFKTHFQTGLLETAFLSPFYEPKMIEVLVAGAVKYPVLRDRIFGLNAKNSALDWAVLGQHREAVQTLLAAADADPEMAAIVLRPGRKHESALNIATSKGLAEIVQVLLSSESYRRHIESDVRNRNINVIQEHPARAYILALLDHYFPAVPREDEASIRLKALGVLMLVVLSATSGHSL